MSCHESQDACCSPACRTKAAYFFGALVVILLGVGINAMLKSYTETGAQAAREARSKERAKAQAEIRQVTATEMTTSAALDKAKGVYRIPVTTAMELTLKEYQSDAAAARTGFVKRIEDWAKPPVLE
ncbi:MAG: hypothetical protein B9S33_05625 [Pedosphaera sp. Tous-C6FEB]|nr:MAG: hypothetical protein B9S33_05625 [Pedosphaera sp. Tous-C6FEB]